MGVNVSIFYFFYFIFVLVKGDDSWNQIYDGKINGGLICRWHILLSNPENYWIIEHNKGSSRRKFVSFFLDNHRERKFVSDSCFKFMLACYLNYLNYNHLVDCYVITIIIIFFDVSLVQGYFCYVEVVLIKNVFLFIIIIIIIIVIIIILVVGTCSNWRKSN
jgi:hypothetical protein